MGSASVEQLEARRLLTAYTVVFDSNANFVDVEYDGGLNDIAFFNEFGDSYIFSVSGSTLTMIGTDPLIVQSIDITGNTFSVDVSGGDDLLYVNPSTVPSSIAFTLSGNTGNDTIIGGNGNEQLNGNSGNDSIDGTGGNDIIAGNSGNDWIWGGAGGDTLVGHDGDDTIGGGGGDNDTADYSYATVNLDIDLSVAGSDEEGATYVDSVDTSIETLIGGSGHDKLTGNSSKNRIEGRDGNDTITGGSNEDSLYGQNGNDWFFAQDSDNDTIDGGNNTDSMSNKDLVDTLLNIENP